MPHGAGWCFLNPCEVNRGGVTAWGDRRRAVVCAGLRRRSACILDRRRVPVELVEAHQPEVAPGDPQPVVGGGHPDREHTGGHRDPGWAGHLAVQSSVSGSARLTIIPALSSVGRGPRPWHDHLVADPPTRASGARCTRCASVRSQP